MKKTLCLLSIYFALVANGVGQIVIDQLDMPVAGDTLRVSQTNLVPEDFRKTAMDTTWNFAMLEALSQRIDTFVNVTQTPILYQFVFIPGLVANLASPRSSSFLPGVSVTNAFTFFQKTSSSYSDVGSAFTIQGLPFPARYDNPEKLFDFPVSPNKTWSSVSSFAVNIPNLVFFSTRRTRTNVVDGWGSLITPFGTFQTLRVKSEILEHDSVYIDSLGFGFPFNRNITEYKWLAKGKGIPVLTVSEEGSNVTAVYRDIPRMSAVPLSVSVGPDSAVLFGTTITLHAVIRGGTPPYQVVWNTLDSGQTLTITVQDTRTYTVIVIDALQNISSAQRTISVKYPPGIGEQQEVAIGLFPNPSPTGMVSFKLSGTLNPVQVKIFNGQGRLMKTTTIDNPAIENSLDLSGFPSGLYAVYITDGTRHYCERLIINTN